MGEQAEGNNYPTESKGKKNFSHQELNVVGDDYGQMPSRCLNININLELRFIRFERIKAMERDKIVQPARIELKKKKSKNTIGIPEQHQRSRSS